MRFVQFLFFKHALEIIQQNFTALLDAPEISSDLLPAKKEPVSVTREK